jgi:hypothetical protein
MIHMYRFGGKKASWPILRHYFHIWDTQWRSWLRHCTTSRMVTGSIPDCVVRIFHWQNPSCRTIALGLTQSLTKTSTRNISWGVKATGALGWQSCHLHVRSAWNLGDSNPWKIQGLSRPVMGLLLLSRLHARTREGTNNYSNHYNWQLYSESSPKIPVLNSAPILSVLSQFVES